VDLRSRALLQHRIDTSRTLVWLLVLLLGTCYAYVQLVLGGHLQEMALNQAVRNRAMPAPRGIVYDRNGHKLVDNHRALHLVIQWEDLPKDPARLEPVAAALDLDPDLLKRRVQLARSSPGSRMVTLLDNLDDAAVAKAELLRARFPFLSIDVAPRRSYRGDSLAAHVLGYVGEVSPELMEREKGRYQIGEIIGKDGFEASGNDRLKGQDGMRRILVDNLGREVATYEVVDPKPGTSVYLTLDAGLQQVVKEAYGEESGAAVVLDLRDGGVLALHSGPAYDPNMFLNRLTQAQVDETFNNPAKPLINRVTQGLYPPGSTFKLLVALAALDKGIITPDTKFTCHGHKNYYGTDFRCDNVHGTLDLVQAIAQSCDIYFYELANSAHLDVDDIHAAAVRYGITEPTGIDLPQEHTSRVPSRAWKRTAKPKDPKWYAGETISVVIGQGANGLTPISLARFYAMLATRGRLLTPHLYYGTRRDADGKLDLFQPPSPRDTGLSPASWAVLDEGLAQVVKAGTAKASAIPGLTMVGKTGTAQVAKFVDKAHYARQEKAKKDHAWFAGYAPRENPQIAFAVLVENGGFGAGMAAPIAKKICEYWFQQRATNPRPPPGERLPEALHLGTRTRAEATPPPEAPPAKQVEE
jgi:penicillin-binding protein 2